MLYKYQEFLIILSMLGIYCFKVCIMSRRNKERNTYIITPQYYLANIFALNTQTNSNQFSKESNGIKINCKRVIAIGFKVK